MRPKLHLLTSQDLVADDEVETAEAKTIDTAPSATEVTKIEPIRATCERCNHEWTDCCCDQHGWTFFGQYLLLQPRGADPVYAVRALNCTTPPLSTEQIDMGAFSAFKFGIAKECGECSTIGASFTRFESVEEDRAARTTGTDVLRPVLAFDPFVTCNDSTSTLAHAAAGIDFTRVDIDYRSYIDCGCFRFDWLAGFAYGELNQDLRAVYDEGRVNVDADFWGYGAKIGGGAEYRHGCLRGFGHADLTLLASNLKAHYQEIDDGTGVVDTRVNFDQELDRIVPVLDLELGVAVDVCQNTVLKVGYTYSIWFNVVTTPEFVSAVQHRDITGTSDTLTFDGLFARIEYTW